MITTYTTYNDIRAALGVSTDDLEDATLSLPIYDQYLTMELEEVAIDLTTTFSTVEDLPTPTAAQTRFLEATSMFATFALAKMLTGTLPLFAAKQETDSKASGTRFDTGYKDTIASVAKEYGRVRNRLTQSLAAVAVTTTSVRTARPFLSVATPTYDPITNV